MKRFWNKVHKTLDDQCWNWTAAFKENGYGTLRMKRNGKWRMSYAHRVSWELAEGDIPDGLYVCHSCDNRACVNPSHLWLGTHQQNQQDMAKKGRVFSPAKKLTDEQVRLIREELSLGNRQVDIAARYGVQRSHVSRIKTGHRRAGV